MIVAKFGGTAMAAQNFGRVKALAANCGCVVVSAVGREFLGDQKVTDLLIRHFRGDADAWGKVAAKYRRVVQLNGVNIDVDRLLFDALAASRSSFAHCLSLGEELSARIAAAYLAVPYIEAADCVRFVRGRLALGPTLRNLNCAFRGLKCGVMGGFYGSEDGCRRVFSRGGGDVSGALCALAVRAELYQNFTDVNGVCRADPRLVCDASTICALSYREMYRLAQSGAEVLHPDAVRLAARRGVPIRVCNYLNSANLGTTVSNAPSCLPFLSVTQKPCKGGFVTTVLHSLPLALVYEVLQALDTSTQQAPQLPKVPLSDCRITPHTVQIWSHAGLSSQLYPLFCRAEQKLLLTNCPH